MSLRRSLSGALLGLVVASASEAIRFGLGEQRSMGEMLFVIIGFTAFGSIASRFQSSKGHSKTTSRTETKQNSKESKDEG